MSSLSAFFPILDLPRKGGRSLRIGYSLANAAWAMRETAVKYNQYGTASANPQNWWLETYATLAWQQPFAGPLAVSGVRLNLPVLQADIMYLGVTQRGTGTSTTYTQSYCYTNWTFSDWSGASHSFNGFRDCDGTDGYFTSNFWLNTREAADDSGYRIDLTSASDPTVIAPNGDVYHFPGYTPAANGYLALAAYSKRSSQQRLTAACTRWLSP